jgi:hypothetical protein
MRQGMAPQVTVAPEDFSAGATLVGLVVGVSEEVCLEVGALVEAAAAHRTLVGRLLHVQDLVYGQRPRLAEALAALAALERLLLRVDVPATHNASTDDVLHNQPTICNRPPNPTACVHSRHFASRLTPSAESVSAATQQFSITLRSTKVLHRGAPENSPDGSCQ